MKKNLFLICVFAGGLSLISCDKKNAASSLSDSAKEATEQTMQEAQLGTKENPIELSNDADSLSLESGSYVVRNSKCKVCGCPVYRGEYKGYFTSCFSCNHAYGMH